ncbi:hypothetical protein LUZ61_010883 [Rhynchospora tenuis]|uniref:Glycolipid transfer protein domain-containing protein n=1 Tax=Rhynchospora tenuis TaxID=198213 RepID=A0AAD6A072_9POAL|nr:hypothetical protein LUZ61_010883 [Rhynchospora tenuis]
MAGEGEEKVLRKITTAFEPLAELATSRAVAMEVGIFAHACAHVSVLFGCLGIAFKFAEMDYVDDLIEASKSIKTLDQMIELGIEQDSVTRLGSHSRNLLRVKHGLDLAKVLFEEIIKTEANSLRDAATVAYAKVFEAHHGWAIKKAVAAGVYALPSKSKLLKMLNEDGRFFYPSALITAL